MQMQCFQGSLWDLNLFNQKGNKRNFSNKLKLQFLLIKKQLQNSKNVNSSLPRTLPLCVDICVKALFFVESVCQLQNFLLTCIEPSFKCISFLFKLNPELLQLFEVGRHIRMKNGMRNILFNNRLYNHGQDSRIWHFEILSTRPHPYEVRIYRNGILVVCAQARINL